MLRLLELLLIALFLYFLFRAVMVRIVNPFMRGYRDLNDRMRQMAGERPRFSDDEEQSRMKKEERPKIDRSNVQDAEFKDLK